MIFRPKLGQRVRLHYNKRAAKVMPHHGKTGTVKIVPRPGCICNVKVRLDSGGVTIVPRGNLVAIGDGPK